MKPIMMFAICAIVMLMFGCSKKEPVPQPAPVDTDTPAAEPGQLGSRAAALDGLIYVKGDAVTFEEGKVTVVEFWATWCGPCKASIPHLTELQAKYQDKGVTFIGISDEPADTVKPFVENMAEKMDYTVATDPAGKVTEGYMKAFKQNGIPTAFIVDGQGKVAWVGHPMADLDEILSQVADGEGNERKMRKLFGNYFTLLEQGVAVEQARPIAEKIIESAPMYIVNNMAWVIVSDTPKEQRDVEIALKAAEKVNTQSGGNNPSFMDTYAQALFANGKVDEAIAVMEKALPLAKNPSLMDELKFQLEMFEAALTEQTAAPSAEDAAATPAE
ncbi:MAG: redoxin domain-containing protein [Planctomycetota bacterium]